MFINLAAAKSLPVLPSSLTLSVKKVSLPDSAINASVTPKDNPAVPALLAILVKSFDDLLKNSDFISLHVPAQKNYVIGKNEFDKMKDGVGIINAARGGVINEVELVSAIENRKVSFAGLDTFENEPKPEIQLLMNSKLSLTPHIGAATNEAQDRIGLELAEQITNLLN